MTKFTTCEDTSAGGDKNSAVAEKESGESSGKRPSRTTAPPARNVNDTIKQKTRALNGPKQTEDGSVSQGRFFTLADLDKRLSVKRRTLSPDEKAALLGQINTLLREPPNSPAAAEALLAIQASATFVLLGGEWSGFFPGVLGWPADEGLRILKLYSEGRWSEVELKCADAQEKGIDDNSESHRVLASPTPTQPGSRASDATPQMDANSGQDTKGASASGKGAEGEEPQQQNNAKRSKTTPKKARADVASVNAPVKAAREQSFAPDDNKPLATGDIPVPANQNASDTLQADEPASSTTSLSKKEAVLFSECEDIIDENRQSFFELGEALRTIRDGRLYRENYGTFEDYCRKRWDFTRAWAYAQLKALDVRDNLCQPMVDIEKLPEPTHERQVRDLVALEPDHQRAAWKRAAELAEGKEITSGHVQKAVREMKAASVASEEPADSFDPDTTWKRLEKLLLKRIALWPDQMHGDLRARLQKFVEEKLPVAA